MLVRLAQPKKLVLWAENVRVLGRRTASQLLTRELFGKTTTLMVVREIHPDLLDVLDGGNHMHEALAGQ